MPSLKEVRSRIQSVTSTQQITKAMKMVAAAKLRRAQDAILQMRPYAQKLNQVIANVSANVSEEVDNPFGQVREVKNVLIIGVSSDRGLCGAFNANIFKAINSLIEEKYSRLAFTKGITVLTLGKKVDEYYSRSNLKHVSRFAQVFDNLKFEKVSVAAEYAMHAFKEGNFDEVVVVYNEFKNVATQIVRVQQVLPIAAEAHSNQVSKVDYIFEPSAEYLMQEIIPQSIKIQIYKAVLESQASEHGARMTAMEKATENAGELLKELKLTYNRSRQAAITKEILEIVGGADAL
jgi:F-type H+-transporting ATPase subunit gamma